MVPASANAQATVSTQMVIVSDLSIVKTKDLDFGAIVGTSAGTVVMNPTQAPTCTASAGLVHIQECQPATFVGKGTFPRYLAVRIRRPGGNRITLTGPGADMRISNLVIDGGTDLVFLGTNGVNSNYLIATSTQFFTFRVGGTLNVGANQAPGEYSGTFDITITYV